MTKLQERVGTRLCISAALIVCLLVTLPTPTHAEISECYCTSSASGKSPLTYTEADTGGYCHPGDSAYTSCSIIGTCTTMNDVSSCTATASQCSSGLVYDAAVSRCVGGNSGYACSTGTWADYSSGTCVTACPSGQRYDSTAGTCGCGNGDICSDNPDGTNNNTPANPANPTAPAPNTTSGTYIPLVSVPGLNAGLDPTTASIADFLNNIYKFAIGIAVVLAIGMIIYGGFEYALSEALPTKADGKRKIQQALFGLVLVLAPALVFAIINPAILNLSVSFQPLHTTWGSSTPFDPYYTQQTFSGSGSTQYAENACNGSDCTQQAATCTQKGGRPYYDCLDSSGAQVNSASSPITCGSGQTYRVTCIQNNPSSAGL